MELGQDLKKYAAEFVGTAALVFFGVGAAVFGIAPHLMGDLGVALAFGFVLLALVYTFGPISGCNVNPAITLGMLLSKKITGRDAVFYWIAQFLGALLAAGILKLMVSSFGKVKDQTGALGTNSYNNGHITLGGAFLLEVILTFFLVFVVLKVTEKAGAPGFAGLAIGITLAVIHIVGIPLDGTSVNPARSFGPAIFEGGKALSQLWLFIVAPLVGAVVAAGLYLLLKSTAEDVARPEAAAASS